MTQKKVPEDTSWAQEILASRDGRSLRRRVFVCRNRSICITFDTSMKGSIAHEGNGDSETGSVEITISIRGSSFSKVIILEPHKTIDLKELLREEQLATSHILITTQKHAHILIQ